VGKLRNLTPTLSEGEGERNITHGFIRGIVKIA
jgi:hypothetical protein